MAEAKRIRVTLIHSVIGQTPAKVAAVRSLGLKKINSSKEHNATPSILGMVASVSHLVKCEEIN